MGLDGQLACGYRAGMGIKTTLCIAALGVAVSACGTSSHPRTVQHISPSQNGALQVRSCQQKVNAWRANGPASANYRQLDAVMTSITHENPAAMQHGLVRLGNLAQQAEQWPFPACADPNGYYTRGLSYLITAGDDASGGIYGLPSALNALHHTERLLNKMANQLANYGVN